LSTSFHSAIVHHLGTAVIPEPVSMIYGTASRAHRALEDARGLEWPENGLDPLPF